MSPAPVCGSKISPSHSHKPECPEASSDGKTPNPSRDNFRSSCERPTLPSPQQQTAPDASPAATRQPRAEAEIQSRGQSCENCSSETKLTIGESINRFYACCRGALSPTGC